METPDASHLRIFPLINILMECLSPTLGVGIVIGNEKES